MKNLIGWVYVLALAWARSTAGARKERRTALKGTTGGSGS